MQKLQQVQTMYGMFQQLNTACVKGSNSLTFATRSQLRLGKLGTLSLDRSAWQL